MSATITFSECIILSSTQQAQRQTIKFYPARIYCIQFVQYSLSLKKKPTTFYLPQHIFAHLLAFFFLMGVGRWMGGCLYIQIDALMAQS